MIKSVILSLLVAGNAMAATYNVDKEHSDVGFSIKHAMISNVKGSFSDFTGSFEYDAKKKELKNITVEIDAKSIGTKNADRDKHLRSADFFDVEKFPKLTFKGEKVEFKGNKVVSVTGILTIKDKSKEVKLAVEDRGSAIDPWGNERVGFGLTAEINRQEFGLTWTKALDKAKGALVADEVKIVIEAEAILKKEEVKK